MIRMNLIPSKDHKQCFGCSNGVLQHAFDDCSDDTRTHTPAGKGMVSRLGRLYDPGTEPVRRLLAGVSWIAARRAVRAVTIPTPMTVRAILVAVGTVETGELAGTRVARTDPARMSPTSAASTVYAHARATPAAVRDRGIHSRSAGDSRHDGNADKHHAHHDAHSIYRSCTQPDESIQLLPLGCAVRRPVSAT